MESVKKMKFSADFVHLMTTPAAKLAMERGDPVYDTETNERLTEEIYEAHKQKSLKVPVRNSGILGFKRAKDGEGYEAIKVPGFVSPEIASGEGVVPKLQLEDGQ